ncbi:hypothetical protein ANCCAN_16071 [Ancylostoma caninum]|uniref:Carbohydrate sulfotransferase n=1 Tax=Ancylostoma caninum TaxID=29170 RepID=A0A368G4X1_ANCCA|nr:hypothetical protein ANCCAN_16071 [Ancylostoma caninum]
MVSLPAKVFGITLAWISLLLCTWIWSSDFSQHSGHRSMPVQTGSLHTANRTSREIIVRVKNGSYDTSPFGKSRLVPPFFRYKEEFQVAPKYRLSSCLIEKVMTTITEAIFCYITNTTEFMANQRTISTEVYAKRFCADQNAVLWYDLLQDVVEESRIQYSVVRDPIDRFLSGFVDKCIKYGYCNFTDHFDEYIIVRYRKGPHGVSQVADELDSIFLRAGIPYDIRKEIHEQLLSELYLNILGCTSF